jgi:hypothetical protein
MTTFVVHKGNRDVESCALKSYGISVLMHAVALIRGDVEIMEDRNTIMLTMPSEVGDTAWTKDKVLRYVDILGATTDDQVMTKAQRFVKRYEEQPDASPDKVGTGIILYQLEQFYLMQKSASVFRREI